MVPNRILGSDGKPLGPAPEPPRPVGEVIRALLLAEMANQRESLREGIQTQFKDVEKAVAKKWRWLAVLLALATTFGGILSLRFWSTVPEEVRKQLLEPKVAESVDKILLSKSTEFIDSKIVPLEKRTLEAQALLISIRKDLSMMQKTIDEQRREFSNRQRVWEEQQRTLSSDLALLREQLRISELSTAAKTGDMEAYDEIVKWAGANGKTSSVAKAALHEIEIFYDIDGRQIFYQRWVDSVSKENPGFSPDEVFCSLLDVKDPDKRAAIANTLADIGGSLPANRKKLALEELYLHLTKEKNLMVRARIIRAIGLLAAQQFRPLDKDSVDAWWKLSGNELRSASIYAGLMQALVDAANPEKNPREIIYAIDKTLGLDPDAAFARCVKAEMLLNSGAFDDALKELDEADRRQATYYRSIWVRGLIFYKQGKRDEAIERFNAAMRIAPSLERNLDKHEFLPVRLAPTIVLPSKGKTEPPK